MSKYNVACPSGFPEWSPAQERVQQDWIRVIREAFEGGGFMPIETPLVEREENLVAKGGNPKEIYVLKRLLSEEGDSSHSGNALRFDHTVPLALYVARHFSELSFPFRRYAIGPVMRGERAQKGRYRQFTQCDIDVIGSGELSLLNDAMIPGVIIQIFEQLDVGDFVVRINNRKILTGFFASLGEEKDQAGAILNIVDDLEKIGKEKVSENLKKEGIPEENIQKILDFTKISGSRAEIFGSLEKIDGGEEFQAGVEELKTVVKALEMLGSMGQEKWKVDLSIARGLDYYTGTVYETNLLNEDGSLNTGIGSICSGGRYEDLAEVFTGKKLPGVGISIGLTRLLSQLFDSEIIKPERSSPSEVLVIAADEEYLSQALALGTTVRGMGYKAENYVESKKLGKQFDYANKLGIPVCLVLGENEVKEGTVQVKNMENGEQKEVRIDDLKEFLKNTF